MPIIALQRRLREAGRIRIGEQVATKKRDGTPTTRPGKLDKFRFTSSDRQSIEAIATLCGGEVRPWADAPVGEQYELYADCKCLDVIIPPVDLAFSQWNELWSGGGCVRRCDGQTNVINDTPCACDPDNQECKPTTRLGVILTAIEGIGVWRLETHGWNAAAELNGAIEVLRVIQTKGAMVPARLMLEQRQSKRDGKTFNFAVPVLDLNLSVAALTAGSGDAPRLASGVTPLHPDEPPTPSIVDQLHAHDDDEPKPKRANSTAPLPPTGLKPKSATDDFTVGGASKRSVKRLFAVMRGNKDIPTDDDGRHAWAREALGLDADAEVSFNDLSQDQITRLNNVADGKEPMYANVSATTQYAENEEPF